LGGGAGQLGRIDAVPALAARYPLAIASSSPPELIEYAMTEAGLRRYFAHVVSADTVGRGKPHPDVFLAAADRLGVSPGEIAVFEDSGAGIAAARSAGMHVIAVPNPHYPPSDETLATADRVLASLRDATPEVVAGLAASM